MELSAIVLVALVVMMTGISKSAFAGALGVFTVPLLMLKFSAVEAIALMLPLLIIADAMSLRSFWKKWDASLLASLIPGAILGITLANLTMGQINAEFLRWIIALICIVFAIKNLWFKQLKLAYLNSRWGAVLMSASSGVTSTLVHAGGPPLIIYFTAIGLPQTRFVATAAAFFAIMNLFKLVGVLALGVLSLETVFTAAAFFPLAILGNRLGVFINQRLDKLLFLRIMNCLLLVLGVWLMFR